VSYKNNPNAYDGVIYAGKEYLNEATFYCDSMWWYPVSEVSLFANVLDV
jgi:hypothetical protein